MEEIIWISSTNEYTVIQRIINSDDPNEPYETGYRNTYLPFLGDVNSDVNSAVYKEMHGKLFADGPKLKFVPSDEFVGSLFGYIFQMGPKGLGYYIDPMIMRYVFYKI